MLHRSFVNDFSLSLSLSPQEKYTQLHLYLSTKSSLYAPYLSPCIRKNRFVQTQLYIYKNTPIHSQNVYNPERCYPSGEEDV